MENLALQIKEQGMVLITVLVMVIAITGVSVTLMSSSNIDIKITTAAQERQVAEAMLLGEVQRVFIKEALSKENSRFFYSFDEIAKNTSSKQGMIIAKYNGMVSHLTHLNEQEGATECPRSFNFTAGISCNMVQVTTTIEYGSKSQHSLIFVTGIAQQMASTSNGI